MAAKDDFDADKLKEATKEATTKLQQKGAAMYEQAAKEVDAEDANTESTEKVEEGEVIEPDDEKKK
ncbi:MAG: hypothetical protein UZ20_WS6002000023 [candidate division WS6 bacterium OLB21]|uniref:Uncharacterized protein n=2 Tax=Candidatus Dojkabacteria TaxID=74243 RepID=A0A136KLD9_9BACT|nr:MAG: hypothetical protein UZ20_WS6002000023 [candidate division WS6 bacterium OLB21]